MRKPNANKVGEITNYEEALAAVREDGMMLEYVPKKLRTAELCLAAVRQNGGAFQYVPKELKTAELCLETVKDFGWVFKYVPEELREEFRQRLESGE